MLQRPKKKDLGNSRLRVGSKPIQGQEEGERVQTPLNNTGMSFYKASAEQLQSDEVAMPQTARAEHSKATDLSSRPGALIRSACQDMRNALHKLNGNITTHGETLLQGRELFLREKDQIIATLEQGYEDCKRKLERVHLPLGVEVQVLGFSAAVDEAPRDVQLAYEEQSFQTQKCSSKSFQSDQKVVFTLGSSTIVYGEVYKHLNSDSTDETETRELFDTFMLELSGQLILELRSHKAEVKKVSLTKNAHVAVLLKLEVIGSGIKAWLRKIKYIDQSQGSYLDAKRDENIDSNLSLNLQRREARQKKAQQELSSQEVQRTAHKRQVESRELAQQQNLQQNLEITNKLLQELESLDAVQQANDQREVQELNAEEEKIAQPSQKNNEQEEDQLTEESFEIGSVTQTRLANLSATTNLNNNKTVLSIEDTGANLYAGKTLHVHVKKLLHVQKSFDYAVQFSLRLGEQGVIDRNGNEVEGEQNNYQKPNLQGEVPFDCSFEISLDLDAFRTEHASALAEAFLLFRVMADDGESEQVYGWLAYPAFTADGRINVGRGLQQLFVQDVQDATLYTLKRAVRALKQRQAMHEQLEFEVSLKDTPNTERGEL